MNPQIYNYTIIGLASFRYFIIEAVNSFAPLTSTTYAIFD